MTRPVVLYLHDAHTIRDGMQIAKYAEDAGFDAVWQADSRLLRDALVPMAACAVATDRIAMGSGVVDCWTCNQGWPAAAFSALDSLAPGRVGARWAPMAAKVGIGRAKPLGVMGEVVTARRVLLQNGTGTMNWWEL